MCPNPLQNTFNNDKLWFSAHLKRLRSEKEVVGRSGDVALFKQAEYRFAKAVGEAKHCFSEKLRLQLSEGNSSSIWKGLRTICRSPQVSDNHSLANDLKEFYSRLLRVILPSATTIPSPPSVCH